MIDMHNLQTQVAIWQRKTFPDADSESCARHLIAEAHEVLDAVNGGGSPQAIAEELGDVVLLAIAVADTCGIELEHAATWSFLKARRRTYAYDPALGYSVHVRGPIHE